MTIDVNQLLERYDVTDKKLQREIVAMFMAQHFLLKKGLEDIVVEPHASPETLKNLAKQALKEIHQITYVNSELP